MPHQARHTSEEQLDGLDPENLEKEINEDPVKNAKHLDALLRMLDLDNPRTTINLRVGISLCRVFSRLIASGNLAGTASTSHLDQQLHDWYQKRYAIYWSSILRLLRISSGRNFSPVLHLCWKALGHEVELLGNAIWTSKSHFGSLLTAVIGITDDSAIRKVLMIDFVNRYHDCMFFAMEHFK